MAVNFEDQTELFNFVVKQGNGVKGMIDSGLSDVPKPFVQPLSERIPNQKALKCVASQPIDLSNLDGPHHKEVAKQIVEAAETLGFFQIFRLKNLKEVSFTDCEGVITVLRDPYETIEKGNKVDKDKDEDWYFQFKNCLKLDRDARELIIQSSLKWTMILPGGQVPGYFNHRASGNCLTVTLPESSLSHRYLGFNVCVVFEALAKFSSSLDLHFRFDGLFYKHAVDVGCSVTLKNHLVLFSFKFQRTGLPSKLESNDVEFKFEAPWENQVIKEVGIRLLNLSPYWNDSRDGRSSETEYNQPSEEKCDVVETENKKKRKRMTSPNLELQLGKGGFHDSMITLQQIPIARRNLEPGLIWHSSCSANSEENLSLPFDQIVTEGEALFIDYMNTEQLDAETPTVEDFNLSCGQIVTDTTLTSPNLELTLGCGDSSSVSSYPCLEGEALCIDSMITEHQDAQLPIGDP